MLKFVDRIIKSNEEQLNKNEFDKAGVSFSGRRKDRFFFLYMKLTVTHAVRLRSPRHRYCSREGQKSILPGTGEVVGIARTKLDATSDFF